MNKYKLIILIFTVNLFFNCGDSKKEYPQSKLSFYEAEDEIGGSSQLSEAKKDDLFKSKYYEHWFTWKGVVVSADDDFAYIKIDNDDDLVVYFADEKAGYNLVIGEEINVKFLMNDYAGLMHNYWGKEAVILK